MSFARFPYPLAPWLMIEVSDVVVLIAYALYGFTGGIAVSVLKTGLDMAIYGLTGVYGIGNITALLTSLMFVLALFITSHILKWFKKGLGFRILSYIVITLFVAIILTLSNELFITPTYLSGKFTTCFDSDSVKMVVDGFNSMGVNGNSYFWLIAYIYFPFNLLKGALITVLYEILFNRLIFVFMSRSPKMKKYFVGSIFKKEKQNEEKTKNIEN